MRARLELIVASHQRLIGRALVPPRADPAQALWASPTAIVAHGAEADPIFFFGNRTALERFGMTFEQFVAMPSRLSAEPMHRDERAKLLQRTTQAGYVDDYQGIRVSTTGRRFRIEQAIVWNLADSTGAARGQAATFSHWTPLVD